MGEIDSYIDGNYVSKKSLSEYKERSSKNVQRRMFEEDDFRDERAYYEEVTLNDVKESESASLFESLKMSSLEISLEDQLENMGASFHDKLFELIYNSGLDNKDIWKRANMDLIVKKTILDRQYDIMQLNLVLLEYTNETLGNEKCLDTSKENILMHIPSNESSQGEILSFENALMDNIETQYDRNKWIFVPNFYSEYRYILGTVGNKPLITIGVNPSTAQPDDLDNTLKSVDRLAISNGFDSFIMFNVYAQRATRPDDMDKVFNENLHIENMKAFRYMLENAEEMPVIWAAWGTIIEKRPYLKQCLQDMIQIGKKYDVQWVRTGKLSKKGHPHHPLYLSKESKFEIFDIEDYVSECLK